MEILAPQFEAALTRIEFGSDDPKAQRVQEAHAEIRDVLESSPALLEMGIDCVLIGSYSRDTAIYPGKDVDVLARLTNLDASESPTDVYDRVLSVIAQQYGERADGQPRSVRIDFFTRANELDFSVDVVPAVRSGSRWAIPNSDTTLWGETGSRWEETNPELLGVLTSEQNGRVSVGGRGAYVPVVKLMRQARAAHLGASKPGGFYFELITFHAFANGLSGDSFAELFSKALRSAANRLGTAASDPLIDPAMSPQAYNPAPRPEDLAAAAGVFASLADSADRALDLDKCEAAVIWRSILGSTDRGYCFPLPKGCDESGRSIPGVVAVRSRGPDEARPFA